MDPIEMNISQTSRGHVLLGGHTSNIFQKGVEYNIG